MRCTSYRVPITPLSLVNAKEWSMKRKAEQKPQNIRYMTLIKDFMQTDNRVIHQHLLQYVHTHLEILNLSHNLSLFSKCLGEWLWMSITLPSNQPTNKHTWPAFLWFLKQEITWCKENKNKEQSCSQNLIDIILYEEKLYCKKLVSTHLPETYLLWEL